MASILVDTRVLSVELFYAKNTLDQGSFEHFRKQLNLRSWKTGKGNGKIHGKSWKLKSS